MMFFAALAICWGISGQALAQASYDNSETPEGWAWARIKEGQEANFNKRCGTPALDPRAEDETGWTNSCRRISGKFLVDILTLTPWRNQVPFVGVAISGARIEGDIDFKSAKLDRPLLIAQSRIENDINLNWARTDSLIGLVGSRIAGSFSATEFRSELSLGLSESEFKQNAYLDRAKISGGVNISGATLDKALDATSIQVGAHLLMGSTDQRKASFKRVSLAGAKITGNVQMNGTFDGELVATLLQVGESLLMGSSKTSFKMVVLARAKVTGIVIMKGTFDGDVTLAGARVGGDVIMNGATFNGTLYADSLQVGASLFMRSVEHNKTSFKKVVLDGARVSSNIFMEGAITSQSISMIYADISGTLDIRGTTLAGLDLSGTSIGRDMSLGRLERPNTPTRWLTAEGKPSELILRNTRITNLIDTQDAWPTKGHLHLDGFNFARLGGPSGETGHEMRARGIPWWDDWARRDPAYSSTPYEQLAAALVAAGDRAAADEVRFLGRVRQRETEKNWWPWILSGFLRYAAGFGIGTYTFRVLYWVIGISVLGGLYLWQCVPAAYQHGPIWCFGASLSRLLPVIEINKEFTDFFNDPHRARLTSWQSFVFSVIGIAGWVLGAILIAAISGLTQKP
jgi:uncharacterized protein YjbI with pentapeptide repeats